MSVNEETDVKERVREEVREKLEPPKRFRVIMHNDDYTSMEFVVWILLTVFRKSQFEAVKLMLMVHHKGQAMVGIYPAQIAETKISAVHSKARDAGFPLRCTMEPEEE